MRLDTSLAVIAELQVSQDPVVWAELKAVQDAEQEQEAT